MNSDLPSAADVDNHRNGGEYQRMEKRLTVVEHGLAALQADVAVIRSNYTTKEDMAILRTEIAESRDDLRKAINEQTWRLVTWVTASMGVYTGLIYFIARNVY